jgi:hypothetical protein
MNCFFVFVSRRQKKQIDQRLYSQIETVSKVKSSFSIGLEQQKSKDPLYIPTPLITVLNEKYLHCNFFIFAERTRLARLVSTPFHSVSQHQSRTRPALPAGQVGESGQGLNFLTFKEPKN